MSLYKIKHLLDAFTAIEKITKNSNMDSTPEVQSYKRLETELIARLIDEGIPYEVKAGKVIVDVNGYANSYNINDIYPYVSAEMQYKLMFKNMQGNMPPNEFLLQQNNDIPPSYTAPAYQNTNTQDIRREQKPVIHVQSTLNDEYVEAYIPEDTSGKTDISDKQEEDEKKIEMPDNPESQITDEAIRNALNGRDDKEVIDAFNRNNYFNKAADSESTDAKEKDTDFPDGLQEIPLEVQDDSYNEPSTTILTADQLNKAQLPPDIKSITKYDMTYEKATLIIRDKMTGETTKLLAVSFPMDEGSGYVISHIATRENSKTLVGQVTETPFKDTCICTKMNYGDTFSCEYTIKNNDRYEITKDSVKHGGKGGRLSIYDEDLTVYVYPIGTKNDDDGDAPIAYYVWSEGVYFCSSTKENSAIFTYKGTKYKIRAVWNEDTVYINISDK